ncbi:hypothetical protein PVAND_008455 [Polypedilum vanderplanki]|uniref:Peptidase S1 domain-containing protein n=1 Tax=Polypedilum vanderplanki TaxID=319348 RepID=A0A9J6CAA0_POLVA|nr:hypothetical protein PVAND_008455 [Polypedilum vanderplanki]
MKNSVVIFLLFNFIFISNAFFDSKIVGGSTVQLGQIPSQISLRTQANVHFCGGALISGRWVITSGQCTSGRAHNSINAVAGTVTLNVGGITQRSVRIVQHPQFHIISLANDVSLIETENSFTMTQHIQTINLGVANLGENIAVQLSGFGATQSSGPLSNNLQRVNVVTITNAACISQLGNQNLQVNDAKLCTFLSGRGMCTGDQGGPVIDMNNQLVAIKSWNIQCFQNFPDGHERIFVHRNWILSVIS